VVDDQSGRPTSARDLADFILQIAPKLAAAEAGSPLFGVVHFANSGEVTWRDFAVEIFAQALGERAPEVGAQRTADYPTPATRPLRATMDLSRLEQVYGVRPRHWKEALTEIVTELQAAS
jgi:dTDP-4-dehydrorhamnose reductase